MIILSYSILMLRKIRMPNGKRHLGRYRILLSTSSFSTKDNMRLDDLLSFFLKVDLKAKIYLPEINSRINSK